MLAREDPVTALDRAEKEYPAAVGSVLRTMAGDMGATAESRKAFISLHTKYGGSRDWDRAMDALGSVAADKDPENLLATVKGTGMPPQKSLQYRNQAISSLMRQNPEKVMAWMLDPTSGVSAEKLGSVYGEWATQHSKEATDWAVRNGKPELIAEGVKSYALSMLRYGSLFGTDDGWSRDLPERFGAWNSVEPAAAETWLNTMPSDIRKFLNAEISTDATE
ncbi:MAG: hypothetical protein EOP87_09345 [Verrucomicrobiaceae bacterium]|nr:MAG: hypothetical protein EOP87_09345 [Verrucomicrobiaceae bacterium]